MKLYHGTSIRHLDSILEHGIQPRGSKKSVWSNAPSRKDMVYLTVAYPLHFALSAASNEDRLIFEINIHRLNPWSLHPDEDFLMQATRNQRPEGCPKDYRLATKWFRQRLHDYARHWGASVEGLGNCCHLGMVPVSALTRYAIIPKEWPVLLWSDPMIMIANYAVMSSYYCKLNATLFGDPVEPLTEADIFMKRGLPTVGDMEGIEVFSVPHK